MYTTTNINTLILRELILHESLLLPNVCILSITSEPANITPDGSTIIPPQKKLEVYHPEAPCNLNLAQIIATEYGIDYETAIGIYWEFINNAIADGVTFTIENLAVIDMTNFEVIAVSLQLRSQLEPDNGTIHIAPLTPIRHLETDGLKTLETPRFTKKTKIDPGATQGMVTISSIILVVAILYLSYYFFLQQYIA